MCTRAATKMKRGMAFKIRHHEPKLDFKDVLIVPRKSTVHSRSQVTLETTIPFTNRFNRRTNTWTGVPIVASNMDTVSGLESFNVLRKHNYVTCFPKHNNEKWLNNTPDELVYENSYMLSCGTNENDYTTLIALMDKLRSKGIRPKFLCVDIANGYQTTLLEVCKTLRQRFHDIILVAGNVVTPEATAELIVDGGVDIVKCGIGCFTKDTKVLMENGRYKNIDEIRSGDNVINQQGQPVRVGKLIYRGKKPVIKVQTNVWDTPTRVTKNHRYLTLSDDGEIKWKPIGSFVPEKAGRTPMITKYTNAITEPASDVALLPKITASSLPDEYKLHFSDQRVFRSNYHIGYIIALFLAFGAIESGRAYVRIPPWFLFKTKNILSNVLKIDWSHLPDTSFQLFGLELHDDKLASFLEYCWNLTTSSSNILSNNRSFIKGMFDVLNRLPKNHATSELVMDIKNWCHIHAHPVKQALHPEFKQVSILDITDENEIAEVWDIQVECPTHSFIANNCIVHNSGSVCETRIKSGVGYPQLSAVLECSEAAHAVGGHLMSDGGIVHPGDIAKAIGAGADFVMVGSLFAGHTESPGELLLDPITNEGYKTFYGMASAAAAAKYAGGLKDYRTAEGKMVRVKHKGSLEQTLLDINGGLRSACTYTNSTDLCELQQHCEFVLVSETHNRSLS